MTNQTGEQLKYKRSSSISKSCNKLHLLIDLITVQRKCYLSNTVQQFSHSLLLVRLRFECRQFTRADWIGSSNGEDEFNSLSIKFLCLLRKKELSLDLPREEEKEETIENLFRSSRATVVAHCRLRFSSGKLIRQSDPCQSTQMQFHIINLKILAH